MLKKICFSWAFGALLWANMGFTACPQISKNIGDLREKPIIEMDGALVTVSAKFYTENIPKLTGKLSGDFFFKLISSDLDKERTCYYEYKSLGIGKRKKFGLRLVHDPNNKTESLADEMAAIQKAAKDFGIDLYSPAHSPSIINDDDSVCTKIYKAYDRKIDYLGGIDSEDSQAARKNNERIEAMVAPIKKQRQHLTTYFNCPK